VPGGVEAARVLLRERFGETAPSSHVRTPPRKTTVERREDAEFLAIEALVDSVDGPLSSLAAPAPAAPEPAGAAVGSSGSGSGSGGSSSPRRRDLPVRTVEDPVVLSLVGVWDAYVAEHGAHADAEEELFGRDPFSAIPRLAPDSMFFQMYTDAEYETLLELLTPKPEEEDRDQLTYAWRVL
jgi:hypothetical protein